MTGTAYLVMKTIHVLAVVLFLGNIIIGVFWKMYGDRSGDPRIIAHTIAGIIRADRLFTIPGAVVLVVFGFAAAGSGHVSLRAPWIVWAIILVVVSALAFMVKLGPLQRSMLALARDSSFDGVAYSRLSRSWALWGSVATIAPIIALVLMVLKPA